MILKSVIELTPTEASNQNDVKVQANIIVTLKCQQCRPLSKTAEIYKLREIIQQVISTDGHHAIDNVPNYIKAFQFDIQPVNHPEYTAFALILGLPPNITDRRDSIGNDKLCEEIVNTLPLNESNNLPHALNSTINRWKSIGIIHYTSSKVKVDGRYGKIYGLVYSKTEGGLEAAEAIMNAYPEGTVREICGALPISIHAFPKQLDPHHKHTKGKSQPKKPSDTLSSFVKKMITENNNQCSKYKSVLIKDLTQEALLQRTTHGISGVCDHAFACVPRSLKQNSPDESISYGVTILLHRTGTTITKTKTCLEEIFIRNNLVN